LLPQAAISGFFQIIPEFPADTVFGLVLSYDAKANFPTSTADLTLSYSVSGLAGKLLASADLHPHIADVTGTGTVTQSERLSPNGVVLTSVGQVSATATFAPIAELSAVATQATHANIMGTAEAANLFITFNLVPGPIAGAGLPGLIL